MIPYLFSLLAGFFAKTADRLSDKKPMGNPSLLAGAGYGISGGITASMSAAISPLLFGIVAGNLVAGKFDVRAHQVALAFFIAVPIIAGMPLIGAGAFALFAIAAFLDELVVEKFKKAKKLGYRIVTPAACLLYGAYTGVFDPLLAIIVFDAGYLAGGVKVI